MNLTLHKDQLKPLNYQKFKENIDLYIENKISEAKANQNQVQKEIEILKNISSSRK